MVSNLMGALYSPLASVKIVRKSHLFAPSLLSLCHLLTFLARSSIPLDNLVYCVATQNFGFVAFSVFFSRLYLTRLGPFL